ncbi:outer membrane protein assembly factor BamE [Motiliproteus coralliicola]|uniref:Outer membrane protein assembly factor BamE n=1 Tax=Motiliproteus coralliicola TaxID=2283196 RepID=A0A369WCS5_9GAMM|nr:outer membrane protein assembly factor BamE [Motiliproteus coralliicola]RDE18979.1 outer membrane protein assembly factor BamE [Motiliproteus coralliicola]
MQKNLISTLALTTALISLSGCSSIESYIPEGGFFPGVHKIDVQQGNLITQEMVNKLKPGMTRSQVRYIMGSPIVTDTFTQNRWDYFYSLKPGYGELEQKRLTLYFEDDKLVQMDGDYRPQPQADTTAEPQ